MVPAEDLGMASSGVPDGPKLLHLSMQYIRAGQAGKRWLQKHRGTRVPCKLQRFSALSKPSEAPPETKFSFGDAEDYSRDGDEDSNTPRALAARHKLRHEPAIEEWLDRFFALGAVEARDENGYSLGMMVTRESYVELSLSMQRVLFEDFELKPALEVALQDWDRDVGRAARMMSRDKFADSIFELADLWTDSIGIETYSAFLSRLHNRIALQSPNRNSRKTPSSQAGSTGGAVLRGDLKHDPGFVRSISRRHGDPALSAETLKRDARREGASASINATLRRVSSSDSLQRSPKSSSTSGCRRSRNEPKLPLDASPTTTARPSTANSASVVGKGDESRPAGSTVESARNLNEPTNSKSVESGRPMRRGRHFVRSRRADTAVRGKVPQPGGGGSAVTPRRPLGRKPRRRKQRHVVDSTVQVAKPCSDRAAATAAGRRRASFTRTGAANVVASAANVVAPVTAAYEDEMYVLQAFEFEDVRWSAGEEAFAADYAAFVRERQEANEKRKKISQGEEAPHSPTSLPGNAKHDVESDVGIGIEVGDVTGEASRRHTVQVHKDVEEAETMIAAAKAKVNAALSVIGGTRAFAAGASENSQHTTDRARAVAATRRRNSLKLDSLPCLTHAEVAGAHSVERVGSTIRPL